LATHGVRRAIRPVSHVKEVLAHLESVLWCLECFLGLAPIATMGVEALAVLFTLVSSLSACILLTKNFSGNTSSVRAHSQGSSSISSNRRRRTTATQSSYHITARRGGSTGVRRARWYRKVGKLLREVSEMFSEEANRREENETVVIVVEDVDVEEMEE
jgi:hypothetical protein